MRLLLGSGGFRTPERIANLRAYLAAHLGAVDQVVVDERRHVDELDRRAGRERTFAAALLERRRQEHEHGPQPLSSGRERLGAGHREASQQMLFREEYDKACRDIERRRNEKRADQSASYGPLHEDEDPDDKAGACQTRRPSRCRACAAAQPRLHGVPGFQTMSIAAASCSAVSAASARARAAASASW